MRSEKKLLLDDLVDKLQNHPSFLVADYQGLGAAATVDFRRQMRTVSGEFEVVRKRLFLKALEQVYTPFAPEELPGHIGVVFARDEPLDVIKGAFAFKRESGSKMRFLASRFQTRNLTASQTEELSKLPTPSVMRAQLLATFSAPSAQLVGVMNSLLASVPNCLEQRLNQQQPQS